MAEGDTTLRKSTDARTSVFEEKNRYTEASHALHICANAVPDSFVLCTCRVEFLRVFLWNSIEGFEGFRVPKPQTLNKLFHVDSPTRYMLSECVVLL